MFCHVFILCYVQNITSLLACSVQVISNIEEQLVVVGQLSSLLICSQQVSANTEEQLVVVGQQWEEGIRILMDVPDMHS